jgi:hypothetical protein
MFAFQNRANKIFCKKDNYFISNLEEEKKREVHTTNCEDSCLPT